MASPHNSLQLPKSVGNGLVMRLATPADTETVAEFNTRMHPDPGEPSEFLRDWTRLLMSGRHPTTSAMDFVLIEDTQADHKLVSVTCLIPQVWLYDGIPFGFGQPELVATEPDYRGKGLMQPIFDTIHALSAAYGHLAQGITGIPYFYRRFGYEYALNLGGHRRLPLADVPELRENETEPYRARPATPADAPALTRIARRQAAGKLMTTPIDESRWRYQLTERTFFERAYCLVDPQEQIAGFFVRSIEVWRTVVRLSHLAVDEGVPLHAALPTVARALKAQAEALTTAGESQPKKLTAIEFSLGANHPAYDVFDSKLSPLRSLYSWYIRVPDVPGFIRHIAPALEKRLAGSALSGYSGQVKLTFYNGGLRLVFEQGRLTVAEEWRRADPKKDGGDAGFPPLVFLKLLFGYRSLAEIRDAFPDCWANDDGALLLNTLFPKQPSWIAPLT